MTTNTGEKLPLSLAYWNAFCRYTELPYGIAARFVDEVLQEDWTKLLHTSIYGDTLHIVKELNALALEEYNESEAAMYLLFLYWEALAEESPSMYEALTDINADTSVYLGAVRGK